MALIILHSALCTLTSALALEGFSNAFSQRRTRHPVGGARALMASRGGGAAVAALADATPRRDALAPRHDAPHAQQRHRRTEREGHGGGEIGRASCRERGETAGGAG